MKVVVFVFLSTSRIISNTVVNGVASAINALVTLVVTSVLIRQLGAHDYGLWLLILSASYAYGYLSIGDLGLGDSLLRKVAAGDPTNDEKHLSYVASNSLVASIFSGIAVIGFSSSMLCLISAWSSGNYFGSITIVLALALVLCEAAFEIISSVFRGFLEGREQFVLARSIDTLGRLIWGTGSLFLILNGWGIVGLAVMTASASVFRFICYSYFAFHLRQPMKFQRSLVSKNGLKNVIRDGLHLNGLKVVSIVYGQMDRTIIALMLSVSVITTYDISFRFLAIATLILTTASSAVIPATAKAHELDKFTSNRILYLRGSFLTAAAVAPICIGAILYAPDLIEFWVGPGHLDAVTPARLFLIFPIMASTNQIGIAMLTGIGKSKEVLRYSMVSIAFNLFFSILLGNLIGVRGVVLGTLLGNGLTWFG